jgi:hypothetical protein
MTEPLTPSARAPAASSRRPEPPSRSGLVTASGIVVAILPGAIVAAALVMRFDSAQVRSMLARGDIGGIVDTAVFLVVLALVTLAGIAIANRWRGWRCYAGTLGWLFVVLACLFVNDYFGSLDVELFFTATSHPRAMIALAAPVALLGIFLLAAKRDEPPPQPTRPLTAIGVAVIVFGSAMLAGNVAIMILAPDRATGLAVPVVIGGLIALMGYAIARRGPGWRIYTGALAWFLIAVGAVSAVAQFQSSHARFATRLCELATVTAMSIGLGWLVLWSKRREPRPAPKPVEPAAA